MSRMPDLSPANQALMEANPLDSLRRAGSFRYTPSTAQILEMVIPAQRSAIIAEEYPHLVHSRETEVRRTTDDLNLIFAALKQSLIYDIKQAHGEWVAMA